MSNGVTSGGIVPIKVAKTGSGGNVPKFGSPYVPSAVGVPSPLVGNGISVLVSTGVALGPGVSLGAGGKDGIKVFVNVNVGAGVALEITIFVRVAVAVCGVIGSGVRVSVLVGVLVATVADGVRVGVGVMSQQGRDVSTPSQLVGVPTPKIVIRSKTALPPGSVTGLVWSFPM